LRFWDDFQRPKVIQNDDFSKHEKHEKSMAGAANLRLEGAQKSIKNETQINEKT